MARVAAVLPGYATVARVAEVLHLAPRSVRDLIYSGRLPSLRIGRLHYVRSSDLELERRRRLGLRLPRRAPRPPRPRLATRPRAERARVDPAVRRQRAAERAEVVRQWAQRHSPSGPRVPFVPIASPEPTACGICGREARAGQRVLEASEGRERLCLNCGRRALLEWADRRRLEAAAARRMAQDLGARAEIAPVPRVA